MVGLEELDDGYVILHRSDLDPERERELAVAHGEIKALKVTETPADMAVEELSNKLKKLDEKLGATENLLEHKNLEIKKLNNEKKEALAAQFAAEAALRRVHANQKEDVFIPVESIIAPLEADIKIYKNEIASLQENNKDLECLAESKESALLEAERNLRSALERALIVDEVINHNFELKKQIEICQEKNRILENANSQKIVKVEKPSKTTDVLHLQAEIQGLKVKLALSDRKVKAEAQIKDKMRLRIKTLEEGLKREAAAREREVISVNRQFLLKLQAHRLPFIVT